MQVVEISLYHTGATISSKGEGGKGITHSLLITASKKKSLHKTQEVLPSSLV